MNYILLSVAIIVYIGWLFGSLILLAEADEMILRIGAVISIVLAVAVLIWAYDKEQSNDRPCAIYKTRMEYNPALKMVMKMEYCAERGEWVTNA